MNWCSWCPVSLDGYCPSKHLPYLLHRWGMANGMNTKNKTKKPTKKPPKKKHVDTANIMDRFLAGLPHKRDTGDEALPNMNFGPNQAKDKKIWWSTTVGNEDRLQFVVCLKVLAGDNLKPYKLRCHLETKYPEHKDKSVDFFRQKLLNCCAQQCLFTNAGSVSANVLLSF